MLKGRLNIIPFSTIDLSLFQGRWYLNWGPGAVFYILVFKIVGLEFSDKFYTFVAGIANVFIFYLLIEQFIKYFKIKLSHFSEIFILISFALASPNLYLSLSGRVWFTEQITAAFYLLISLLALFKFLNKKEIKYFLISVIFFNLAWFTRAPLIFHGFLFATVLFQSRKEKEFKKVLAILVVICSIFLFMFFTYNYLRFQNILETGLHYHNGNPRYEQILKEGKIFSTQFIQYNFYYFFLNLPSFSKNSPYLLLNLEGNSIFAFYPILILIAVFIKKYLSLIKNDLIVRSFLIILVFEVGLLLCYFATGWTQVGMRYFLDLVPITFLSVIFVADKVPRTIKALVLGYGAAVNIIGALIFFKN